MKSNLIIATIFFIFCAFTQMACNREASASNNGISTTVDPQVEKFVGIYSAAEACTQNKDARFSLEIAPSMKKGDEITISNFGPLGNAEVKAVVNNNALTIPKQTVSGILEGKQTEIAIIGNGVMNDKVMNIAYSYSIASAASPESCSMTCTRN